MHICDYGFIAQNGKPGVIGIFEMIGSATFPAVHAFMCIAVQFRGQAGHVIPVRIVVETQNGEKVVDTQEQQLTLGKEGGILLAANLVGATFKTPGRYSVVVISQGAVWRLRRYGS